LAADKSLLDVYKAISKLFNKPGYSVGPVGDNHKSIARFDVYAKPGNEFTGTSRDQKIEDLLTGPKFGFVWNKRFRRKKIKGIPQYSRYLINPKTGIEVTVSAPDPLIALGVIGVSIMNQNLREEKMASAGDKITVDDKSYFVLKSRPEKAGNQVLFLRRYKGSSRFFLVQYRNGKFGIPVSAKDIGHPGMNLAKTTSVDTSKSTPQYGFEVRYIDSATRGILNENRFITYDDLKELSRQGQKPFQEVGWGMYEFMGNYSPKLRCGLLCSHHFNEMDANFSSMEDAQKAYKALCEFFNGITTHPDVKVTIADPTKMAECDMYEVTARVEQIELQENKHTVMSSTGNGYYDRVMQNPPDGIIAEIEYMSPEDYFRKCAEIHGVSYEEELGELEQERVDRIANEIENNDKKMPLTVLDFAKGGQDGRHRAGAFLKLGVPDMPVLVVQNAVEETTTSADIAFTPADMGLRKPRNMQERFRNLCARQGLTEKEMLSRIESEFKGTMWDSIMGRNKSVQSESSEFCKALAAMPKPGEQGYADKFIKILKNKLGQ